MCVVWRYGRSFSITDSTATCIMCVTHTFRNTAVATPGMCAWQPSSRAVATSDERVDSPCARMSADNSPVADAARSSACRTGRSSSKRTWRDVRKKDSQTHRSPLGTHTHLAFLHFLFMVDRNTVCFTAWRRRDLPRARPGRSLDRHRLPSRIRTAPPAHGCVRCPASH